MKKWVWACRMMYSLLAVCVVGFLVLKDSEPLYALAIAASGMCIIFPLAVACVIEANKARKMRVTTVRRSEHRTEPAYTPPAGWRRTPDELHNQPTWGDYNKVSHVVDGVAAF
jgi:hypothetical protein